MSIQSEITRIGGNITSAYTAVSGKGGTLPSARNSANLPAAINSIVAASSLPNAEANAFGTLPPPSPYIVTLTQPSGTQLASGIFSLAVTKIKELADAIAAESTVDNNAETVYVWVAAENGYYTISIGDQISWTMDGTSYPYRIMGFNHYDKSDGSGKAGILFQMVDCFNTKYPMKSEPMSSADGWDDSDLRTTLSSTLYGYLPSDVQSAISQVTIKTAQDVSTSTIITTNDKLFLPAEVEVFGSTTFAIGGTNEGVWYPWYKTNNNTSSRVKRVNGSDYYWWERSPAKWEGGASIFCGVYNSGYPFRNNAIASFGVAPCFCF